MLAVAESHQVIPRRSGGKPIGSRSSGEGLFHAARAEKQHVCLAGEVELMLQVEPERSMFVVAIIRSAAISDIPIGAVSVRGAGKDAPRPGPDCVGSDRSDKHNADV